MQFQLREQKGSGVGDGITQWTQIEFNSKNPKTHSWDYQRMISLVLSGFFISLCDRSEN